jgi:hypothetical protein
MLCFTQLWVTELYFGETHHVVPQVLEWESVIRITEGCGKRVSCRNLFKKLQMLPFDITISIIFINVYSSKQNLYLTNIDSHNIDTTQRNNLYLPQANLTTYKKGACYSGKKSP